MAAISDKESADKESINDDTDDSDDLEFFRSPHSNIVKTSGDNKKIKKSQAKKKKIHNSEKEKSKKRNSTKHKKSKSKLKPKPKEHKKVAISENLEELNNILVEEKKPTCIDTATETDKTYTKSKSNLSVLSKSSSCKRNSLANSQLEIQFSEKFFDELLKKSDVEIAEIFSSNSLRPPEIAIAKHKIKPLRIPKFKRVVTKFEPKKKGVNPNWDRMDFLLHHSPSSAKIYCTCEPNIMGEPIPPCEYTDRLLENDAILFQLEQELEIKAQRKFFIEEKDSLVDFLFNKA